VYLGGQNLKFPKVLKNAGNKIILKLRGKVNFHAKTVFVKIDFGGCSKTIQRSYKRGILKIFGTVIFVII